MTRRPQNVGKVLGRALDLAQDKPDRAVIVKAGSWRLARRMLVELGDVAQDVNMRDIEVTLENGSIIKIRVEK